VYKAIREAAVLAGEVLLPNITALKLAELSIFPHIEYFMGPFIETLELPMSIDQGLLSTIVTRYPTLQHVNFTEWSGRSKPEVVNVVSAAICGWSQFQTLSINGLTSSALTHVASLSNLQCLTLQYLDDSTCTLPVSAFSALRSLTLRAETPLQCVKKPEVALHHEGRIILQTRHLLWVDSSRGRLVAILQPPLTAGAQLAIAAHRGRSMQG
jgi:hypothetical protein